MNAKEMFKQKLTRRVLLIPILMLVLGMVSMTSLFAQESHDGENVVITSDQADVQKFGLLAAAVAFGLGAIGAGIAISAVGAAAMGAIGEKPEIAGQAIIFVALAEGIVVFGFISALMILAKV